MNRITSLQAFDNGIERLQQRQRELAQAQERLTSGKRVARASDDPAAAARADLDARFSPDAIAAGFDAVYRRAMEAA